MPHDVRQAAKDIVRLIGEGEYAATIHHCARSRLSSDDIARVVTDHGRDVITLLDHSDGTITIVPIERRPDPARYVAAPLWTREKG